MDMTMESCRTFVEVLASNAPAPGGGGAAALVGAIGTALGNMVGSLTVGKKKYADVQDEILALKARCDELQKKLLDQVEADEVTVIKIAFADREHVQKHQCGDGRGCDISPLTDVGIITGNEIRLLCLTLGPQQRTLWH